MCEFFTSDIVYIMSQKRVLSSTISRGFFFCSALRKITSIFNFSIILYMFYARQSHIVHIMLWPVEIIRLKKSKISSITVDAVVAAVVVVVVVTVVVEHKI